MRIAIGLLQVLLMVGGPLAVAAYLRQRWRLPWGLWAAGAAAFVASQIVHIPLLIVVGPRMPASFAATCGILGALAGLCEEPARYLVFRYWRKDVTRYEQGLVVGVGHGGIESIIIGLLVAAGLLGSLSITADDPASTRAAAAATLDAAPIARVLAVFERVCAMTFHAAMSLIVLAAVRRRRIALLGLAVFLHALFDAIVVWAARAYGMVGAELVGFVAAALSAFVILYLRGVERRARDAARDVIDHAGESPATDQAISARALTKAFTDRIAVDALTVDVPSGSVFALLGPNGAGKTTTVRMLCALIPPTRGTARVAGALLVSEEDSLRAHVGILTETPGLYERLTAYENLDLFGRLYGLDPATRAARIEKHLRAFDIWERRGDAVSGFSKGMKQKVAIVRALIHEPKVLFLDEPTSGLDPVASREVSDAILSLKAQGRTILLTTHRLTEAEQLADLVGIVRSKLLVLDTVTNLKSRMFGKQIEIRVTNPSDALASAVAGVGGLGPAAWEGGVLTVTADDPARRTPELVRALVAGGADILTVGETKHSLEEIYLELVKEKSN